MFPRCAFYKPFMVKFPDKYEQQNGFNPDSKWGLVRYQDGSNNNNGTGAGVYSWGLRRGHIFSLHPHHDIPC